MQLAIIAIGRARDPHFKALWTEYARRMANPPELIEREAKGAAPPSVIKQRENASLLDAAPAGSLLVALDAGGKLVGSLDFASRLAQWRDQGIPRVSFLIGGADGLEPTTLDRSGFILSLGAMTWPHQLARLMLLEQLYRAETILSGHPYHRE